jgi:type IV secretory pathway VirB9-like protein
LYFSKRNKNSIVLDQLFEKIVIFKGKYHEQEKCLELIEKFKSGEKYQKKHYL